MIRTLSLHLIMVIVSFAVWSVPVDIGPPINPDAGHPTFAPNGSFMIFASTRPGGLGYYDLWRSVKYNGVWQTPVNLGSNVNSNSVECSPYLAENGTRLYFDADIVSLSASDIYFSPMTGMVPGPRINLGPPVNTSYNDFFPILTIDGNTMYFASDRPGSLGSGTFDIWVSNRTGVVWSNPVRLSNTINTAYSELPSWISEDGNTLVFSSTQPTSPGGYNIWYTVKTGGIWGTPINFGTPINSADNDIYAEFRCTYGQIGGMMYLTRYSTGYESIFTAIESGFVRVLPSSLGAIKSLYY